MLVLRQRWRVSEVTRPLPAAAPSRFLAFLIDIIAGGSGCSRMCLTRGDPVNLLACCRSSITAVYRESVHVVVTTGGAFSLSLYAWQ